MTDLSLVFLVFFEFFKIGLFAIGGGPATLPYLMSLTQKYDWFTMQELTNMIAVSESTPGPLGVNMATYVGTQTLGPLGGLVATLGLVTPSVIIICIIAAWFTKFNKNKYVQSAFTTIRPAVAAIIALAVYSICKVSLFITDNAVLKAQWNIIIFAIITLGLLQIKKLKKIHPFMWFVMGAIIGLIFKF